MQHIIFNTFSMLSKVEMDKPLARSQLWLNRMEPLHLILFSLEVRSRWVRSSLRPCVGIAVPKVHANSGISQAKRTIVGWVDVAEKFIGVNLMNLFQSFLLKSISCCPSLIDHNCCRRCCCWWRMLETNCIDIHKLWITTTLRYWWLFRPFSSPTSSISYF